MEVGLWARLGGEVAGYLNKSIERKQGAHQCPRTESWVITPDLPAVPARALITRFCADGGALAALVLLAAASISVNSEKRTERSARPPVCTCRSALGRVYLRLLLLLLVNGRRAWSC